MSALFFFPWTRLNEDITVGGFSLVRYSRGNLPLGSGTEEQEMIDDVLKPYLEGPGQPIIQATLLRTNKRRLFEELNDEERADVFIFAELLSLSGLSQRTFFQQIGGYWNRDHFRLIGQKFDRSSGSCITIRRRDGMTQQFWSEDEYVFHKPEHVLLDTLIKLDKPFLESLLKAQELSIWTDVYESILNYNLANTDSAAVTEHTEVVLMVSAFERVLKCDHGKEDDLANKFSKVFAPSNEIALDSCAWLATDQMRDRFRKSGYVRDMWIRDFFRLRGNMAHGKVTSRSPQVWPPPVHLLLGSFAFPLLLKAILQQNKIYELSQNDQFWIDTFESLACANIFNSNHKRGDEYAWNIIIEKKRRECRINSAVKWFEDHFPDSYS